MVNQICRLSTPAKIFPFYAVLPPKAAGRRKKEEGVSGGRF